MFGSLERTMWNINLMDFKVGKLIFSAHVDMEGKSSTRLVRFFCALLFL